MFIENKHGKPATKQIIMVFWEMQTLSSGLCLSLVNALGKTKNNIKAAICALA
jgi:hypothetical protein